MLYFNILRDKQIQIINTLALELVDARMKNYRFFLKTLGIEQLSSSI